MCKAVDLFDTRTKCNPACVALQSEDTNANYDFSRKEWLLCFEIELILKEYAAYSMQLFQYMCAVNKHQIEF